MTDEQEAELHAAVKTLTAKSRRLVEAVRHDDNGSMVAGQWVGGNGGMLSRETLTAADTLRVELENWK
jgi:hypothetical protein